MAKEAAAPREMMCFYSHVVRANSVGVGRLRPQTSKFVPSNSQ